ncbi:uncharacterized protein LOC127252348 [Andrographis paniculata]|uniref:uncharacterized protein LOC127252348 n=1 Tax=Andrographis paniculata TaxID=175694 RepID=UPI0021E80463|nr:uncharacterized protein LOC127252348 [Andrographis paniculata]
MDLKISPQKADTAVFEGDAGGYYAWTAATLPVLATAKLAAGKLVLHRRGYALPHYADAFKIGYVTQGSCTVGLVPPNSSDEKVVVIKKGDAIPVPMGTISWWFNAGDGAAVLVFLGESSRSYTAGMFDYYFLAGAIGVLRGFSTDFVAKMYGLSPPDAEKVAGGQPYPLLVKLAGDERLPRESSCDVGEHAFNLEGGIDQGRPRVEITGEKFGLLDEVGLSAALVRAAAGRFAAEPSYSTAATYRMIYVVRGGGRVQIVGLNGAAALDAAALEDEMFVVPPFFAVAILAGEDGIELFSVSTSARPEWGQLAGHVSAWKALSEPVLVAALNVSPALVRRFKSAVRLERRCRPPSPLLPFHVHDIPAAPSARRRCTVCRTVLLDSIRRRIGGFFLSRARCLSTSPLLPSTSTSLILQLLWKLNHRKTGKQLHMAMMMMHWMQLIMVLRWLIFRIMAEYEGCDTAFVTATARTIDISHAWVMRNAILLVVSPMTCGSIAEMLNKYIFFSDKVEIQDITNQTRMFALLGPKSSTIMEELNLGDLVGQPYGTHKHYSVSGMPLTVAVGSIISQTGFTIMMSRAAADTVWKALLDQGAIHMSPSAWETLRILRGRPAPGKELTNEYNVLEAGLWNAVSLNKGCYKGQETISRLVTYDGVKQRLWGIQLSSPAEPGSVITVDGKKVGKLTSVTLGTKASGHFGLAYVKRTASVGDSVTVSDGIMGTLVEVPYLKEQLPLQ